MAPLAAQGGSLCSKGSCGKILPRTKVLVDSHVAFVPCMSQKMGMTLYVAANRGRGGYMYRLVPYADANPAEDDVAKFISDIVSHNIVSEIDETFCISSDESIQEEMQNNGWFASWYMYNYQLNNFFEGIGQYLGTTDEEAGREIVGRKVIRIREKLLDPNEYYTLDLLEENIFYKLIYFRWADYEEHKKKGYSKKQMKEYLKRTYSMDKAKKAKKILQDEYGLSKKEAKKYSKQMYCFYAMLLKKTEVDNLLFWDHDYILFFEKGFVEGLMIAKGAAGDIQGYGYQYVCNMFSDIGIKPPLRLLGSEEANRLINQRNQAQYMAQMEKLIEYIRTTKKTPSFEDEEFLEAFPLFREVKDMLKSYFEDEVDEDEDDDEEE